MGAKTKQVKVGVKELKNKTTQIIRSVREKDITYVVTVDGVEVAIIMSLKSISASEKKAKRIAVLREIDHLAEKISESWQDGLSAADAVSSQRRG